MAKYSAEEQAWIRQDIFRWLDEQQVGGKYEFSRDDLAGYTWMGEKIRLASTQKGIWNPQAFDETLSILTSINGPYDDKHEEGLYVRYAYQARDGGDNIKLKRAFENQTPLIYFKAERPSYYTAHYPVYVVHDDVEKREFVVALDEQLKMFGDPAGLQEDQRAYLERTILARVHQPVFRARVMRAYTETCAVCHLKHVELLDAAHIIPDAHELGSAHVTNGLALCKIHHAAYDKNLLGISPDYEVKINKELLLEVDGPMLKYGIQAMDGQSLVLPKHQPEWPGRDNLDFRYQQFIAA
jgi:putative restriction endonuclease